MLYFCGCIEMVWQRFTLPWQNGDNYMKIAAVFLQSVVNGNEH